MARTDTNEHGRLIASAIGVAIPKDATKWGYLSEVHEYGMNHQQASDMAEDLGGYARNDSRLGSGSGQGLVGERAGL
jgi:pyruvoyl-dependent arginine decarboxylase (PvlArgDC)